jgi:hypothetical protein
VNQQDEEGNVYITIPGRDASLAAIAVRFPLNSPDTNAALSVLLEKLSGNPGCNVVLVGWLPGATQTAAQTTGELQELVI